MTLSTHLDVSRYRIVLTTHALDRARERVWPGGDDDYVIRNIDALVPYAAVQRDPPDWLSGEMDPRFEGVCVYLVAGDVALVCSVRADRRELVATTIVTAGSRADAVRSRRADSKRAARRSRRARVRGQKRLRGRAAEPIYDHD
jgi:hypothetical protein